jgi:Fe-Mn family superoxide dismutase
MYVLKLSRRSILKYSAAAITFSLCEKLLAEPNKVKPFIRKDKSMQQNVFSAYENGQYTLPPLPYDYDALEPLYDEQTVRIHHDKHHAKYVKNLNAALSGMQKARSDNDYSSVMALSNAAAFNGSGHILHTLFWHSMKPGGNEGKIPSDFKNILNESFGSSDAAMQQFAAATKAVESNGWGILAFEPISNKLIILQCEKHQNLTIWGVMPVLVCDVWEHAYYLKFQNERDKWVENFMKLANWDFALQRYDEARSVMSISK